MAPPKGSIAVSKTTKPKGRGIQMLLLGFLLIVFPLGSFLYLRAGWNYQLDSWNEIDPLGPVTDLLTYPRPDSTIDIVFTSPTSRNDSVAVAIRDIHEAFDDNPDIRFVAVGSGSDFIFNDPDQLLTVADPQSYAKAAAKDGSALTKQCDRSPVTQRAFVVDAAGQVRRCYDLHRGVEVARLVEQVALIMPRPEKEDVFLERKTEL